MLRKEVKVLDFEFFFLLILRGVLDFKSVSDQW